MVNDYDPQAMTEMVNIASKYLAIQGLIVKRPFNGWNCSAVTFNNLLESVTSIYQDQDMHDFLQTSLEQAVCDRTHLTDDTHLYFELWLQTENVNGWLTLFQQTPRKQNKNLPNPLASGDPVAKSTRSGKSTPAISIEDSSSETDFNGASTSASTPPGEQELRRTPRNPKPTEKLLANLRPAPSVSEVTPPSAKRSRVAASRDEEILENASASGSVQGIIRTPTPRSAKKRTADTALSENSDQLSDLRRSK